MIDQASITISLTAQPAIQPDPGPFSRLGAFFSPVAGLLGAQKGPNYQTNPFQF
jgi:hypothetical protein